MVLEINRTDLLSQLKKQLQSFFILNDTELDQIAENLNVVLERCKKCFAKSRNKYYSKDGKTYFNPYHSGQYTIFLYYFSNTIFYDNHNSILADKIYYLNKIMNGCDLFYEIELPDVFMLDHPVGSVMGRATYNNYFSFAQNCTVGNNKGVFPVIGHQVKMCANSMILGNSKVGNNVIIGAGTCIKDQDIPDNSIVFGSSPNLTIKAKKYG